MTALYIDGFGIGEDADQLRILKRINGWLNEDGYALRDIYEPNYWRQVYKGETIYSPDNKVLTISLSNFDKDDKTINKINNIINTISKENDLNSFTVELSETKK